MNEIITTLAGLDLAIKRHIANPRLFNWSGARKVIRAIKFRQPHCPKCGGLVGYVVTKLDDRPAWFILMCDSCKWHNNSEMYDTDLKIVQSLPCGCDFGSHKYVTLQNGRKICARCGEWKT